MNTWFVYIVRCKDGSFYVGATNDVEERVRKHNAGKGGSYTYSHRPVELAYTETCSTKSEALKREASIKSWSRRKKEELVQRNPRSSRA